VTRANSAGRPAIAVDPASPFAGFALGLRELRDDAHLSLRQLAHLAGFSMSVLSEAANGRSLPALDVTLAYVRSCGGDPRAWSERWLELASPQRIMAAKEEQAARAGHDPDPRGPGPHEASAPPPAGEMNGLFRPCHVSTASGQAIRLAGGSHLVFGRGPEVDLAITAGRGLSRRAGVIRTTPEGAWIANISRTHALYVAGDGYRIRLPRMEADGDPAGGWLIHEGTAMAGSRSMMDDGLQLAITVPGRHRRPGAAVGVTGQEPTDGDSTLLPFYLDPMTKLFLVALMWCRPWLIDPSAASPLPRTPEIARAALEATRAHHELERFDTDPEFRDLLSSRVAEHIKVLRRKITERGLAGPDVRLSDEIAVRVLIEHGVIATGDLRLLQDPAWCTRQEGLWWTRE
jgi:transcriptional regulator with XRE-family HTH domain